MLDINFIRENPEKVKLAAEQKLIETDIDRLLELDGAIKALNNKIDALRTRRNSLSAEVKDAPPQQKAQIAEQVRAIKDELAPLEQKLPCPKFICNICLNAPCAISRPGRAFCGKNNV